MDHGGAMRELPRYLCHKEVWALKIAAINGYLITPANGEYAEFAVAPGFIEKHKPEVGGYVVQYEDGYKSYSPAAAFESGYAPIPQAGGEDPIVQFFAYSHLPEHLRGISRMFGHLAYRIVDSLPRNPERTVALRKLLEAKDAGVRAKLFR